MNDKCNCYRFSPRDSLSGAVAQIADYLSKHPGWNETELRAFVDGLISSAGVETFNGRSGNVTLNKDDVNNLLIANCYFAEADETIESIDVLTLYKLGVRIVFTQYSSEVDGYTLAYGIEYYPTTDTAKAYLFSSGSGGVGAVVSVNGKTGTVILKASDISMNNGDSVEDAVSNAKAIANAAYSPDNPPPYPVNSVNSKTGSVMLKVVDVSNGNSPDDNAYIFIDETENYPDIIAPDSNKLGGQIPSYYATAESVNSLKDDLADAWTSGKTYAVGDYCIYGNQLYKCKTAYTAGSAFSADYWDAVSVSGEIANMHPTVYYCGGSGETNYVIFDASNWDSGTYILTNVWPNGLIVEFLRKRSGDISLTNIYSSEHKIDGNTVTLYAGTWYAGIYAKKID